jgi:hypothetical protein
VQQRGDYSRDARDSADERPNQYPALAAFIGAVLSGKPVHDIASVYVAALSRQYPRLCRRHIASGACARLLRPLI